MGGMNTGLKGGMMFNFWNKKEKENPPASPFAKGGQEGDLASEAESKKLWKELASAEANGQQWCCKAWLEIPAHLRFVSLQIKNGFVTMQVACCPRCGKALK